MRVTCSTVRKERKKKILKLAKGFVGRKGKCATIAIDHVWRAGKKAYISRRLRRRDMKSLFIVRINAAVRKIGLSYSRFINLYNLKVLNNPENKFPILNRKGLAEFAAQDEEGFLSAINNMLE